MTPTFTASLKGARSVKEPIWHHVKTIDFRRVINN